MNLNNKASTKPADNTKLSTNELATTFRVAAQSIRAALCNNGHYLGLRPTKLPNGRLLWSASAVTRLLAGEAL
jgi:hypothetical protein